MSTDTATIHTESVNNGPARTVVICGSMEYHELMSWMGSKLRSFGVRAIPPRPDQPAPGPPITTAQLKRDASKRHMNLILDPDTVAILVVNIDRPGVPNYIGPNTFAEIAVAFAAERQIFLLHDIPDTYKTELTAWAVTCLNGDVRPLLDQFAMTSVFHKSTDLLSAVCAP